jgi:hypothetical protein
MTFPTINPQDYVTNIERSEPIELPQLVYVVYYKGDSGQWIWSFPSFYKQHAIKFAKCLNRPTKILTYNLHEEEVYQQRKIKTPTKVRKVRKVKQ